MKLNILKLTYDRPLLNFYGPRTHEGAPAVACTPAQALRRSVLACMLWEDEFYESGSKRLHGASATASTARS